ncbi:MAG: hypothetical protein H7Y37_07840 [Anaerolineae bacterium]|nr:hypothetical protein [Gloeobacterales cyanobacterium ES-bin-313]
MINPQRFTPGGCPDSVLCASFGLSLYATIENARRKLKNLAKSIAKRGYNTIGTHIAEGVIDRNDGVISPIGSDGHFTLHESTNADLAAKFVVVHRVI